MRNFAVVVVMVLSLALVLWASGELFAAERGVYSASVGDFKVHMLSEAQRDSGLDILIGASPEDIAKFIPSGSYPSAVAAYLVETPNGAVLIDTGFGRELESNLKSLGFSPSDISTVLITHSHGDHIGGLVKEDGAAAFPNAEVFIAKLDYDWSAQVREYLEKYDRFTTIDPGTLEAGGKEVAGGISAIMAYGHTPGHTMFMVESGNERMLIWGDLAHAMAIQMPRPGVSVTYDSDPAAAAAVRKSVLEYAASNKIPVAGMHVAYPGIGSVAADPGNPGGYVFTPAK
jgi:glyoxylase-like metal-dependent hydrolase (beta-lactamase superfamily II)